MTRIAPQKAYAVLGVTPEDDFATIRKAWVRLVKENHPDALGGDIETASRRLARINDAYDSLRWHSPQKLRIHKKREEKRLREENDRRVRQQDARRTRRPKAAPGPKTNPASSDAESLAIVGPVLRQVRSMIGDHARRKYLEVQEICDHAADSILTRSA